MKRLPLALLVWLVACPLWAQEKVVDCAPDCPPEKPPLIDPMRASAQSMGAKLLEDFPVADQQTVVTVLMAYSLDQWRALGGTRTKILAHAQQVIDQWNTARADSIDAVAANIKSMELGGIMLTSYWSGQPNHDGKNAHGDSMLGWMSAKQSSLNDGGYEEVYNEKVRIGADSVISVSNTDACGLAYECASETFALASTAASCTISNLSAIHEHAHNECGNHEPQTLCNAATCPGTTGAGYGWGGPVKSEVACASSNCSGHAVHRDPLTYPREGGSRVLRWSSPRKTEVINGVAYTIGTANNDNALAISDRSPLTANYRVTTGAGPLPIPAVGSLKASVH